MTDINLAAIRARDADYNDVFEAQASMSKDIAHRLVAWPVADRRALLAYVDELREAAGKVTWFDYSDADDDVQQAINDLRRLLGESHE